MHNTELHPDVVELIKKRRGGKMHATQVLDPAKTALVVVDMQVAFLQPGLPSEVPPARDIVPNINRLAAGMREAGGTVVWVQNTFDENIFQDWSAFLGKITNQELARGIAENLYEGSEGHALWPELETKEGDIWTKKNRYSAFLPEACDLAETLRDRDIDTVVITGTLTNVCCESSVRDAFMRNFSVVIVADGNATYTDAIHNASMTSMAMTFGDVMTTDEVLGKLEPVRVAAE